LNSLDRKPSNRELTMPGAEALVTFADGLFEGFAIDDFDLSALVPADHSQSLKLAGGLRHGGPANA
jgi:hypothetical protein